MTALANVVLVLHALVVRFIVGGFAAICVGAALGWAWVRERRFRFTHLMAIGIVALLANIVVLVAVSFATRPTTVAKEQCA